MNITYYEKDGLFYPKLKLPKESNHKLGKYAQMRLDFIKKHKRYLYSTLLIEGKLNEHLYDIEIEARRAIETLIYQIAHKRNITETLKSENPLLWAQEMNNAKSSAEENIFKELIFL